MNFKRDSKNSTIQPLRLASCKVHIKINIHILLAKFELEFFSNEILTPITYQQLKKQDIFLDTMEIIKVFPQVLQLKIS